MIIKIFNKMVKININNSDLKDILKEELQSYTIDNITNNVIDAEISFVDKIDDEKEYSSSPKIHKTFQNGFLARFGSNMVKYLNENEQIKIFIKIDKKNNFIHKFRSIDYRSNIEQIGTMMHELIFVFLTFFDSKLAPIHASSMKNLNEKVFMIGGAGGVGKTSLELMLCRDLGYSFISDDIAIIDNNCNIYPNLSYPKIYAYNTTDNIDLEKILLKNKSFTDKFQWKFLKKIRGLSRVRRSISPFIIFNSVETTENTINEYYILHKTNLVNDIEIDKINSNLASYVTLDIMKNEYHSIIQHIIWNEYNSKLMSYTPILSHGKLYSNWLKIYQNIFKKINCYVIRIPINISHKNFLHKMKKKFKGA